MGNSVERFGLRAMCAGVRAESAESSSHCWRSVSGGRIEGDDADLAEAYAATFMRSHFTLCSGFQIVINDNGSSFKLTTVSSWLGKLHSTGLGQRIFWLLPHYPEEVS